MSRWPATHVVLLFAALLFGGVVAALATSADENTDPAPPAASRDVPGLVSIGRPISPVPAGSPRTGQLEMRITDPAGGVPRHVLFHERTRDRQGRRQTEWCYTIGRTRDLRDLPLRTSGDCMPIGKDAYPGVWNISTGAGSDGTVMLWGRATSQVRRVTVAGPGGTFVVPRSQHGAFVVAYTGRAKGRAVLTATLIDGSTRFFRTQIPPSFRPDGVAIAADPSGLPDWYTMAATYPRGPRAGQTCLQVSQDRAIRAKTPARQGGVHLAPACGDLRRAPVFARTVVLGASDRMTAYSFGRFAPRRTILAGAATRAVKSVAVDAPDGRRELAFADAGRAFVAVFPQRVRPADLTLEVTLVSGEAQRYPDPVAVNRATTRHPPPRLVGKVRLRQEPAGGRRVVLDATLTDTPKRFEITFLGREVRMRPVPGGPSQTYRGVYDGTRGVRRPIVGGRVYGFTVLSCGDVCSTELQRARLR